MSQPLPDGYVDPADVIQVEAVLADAIRLTGLDGLAELLARLPGVEVAPGRPGGFLRQSVPASVWLGTEHNLTLVSPAEHQHVVGGVVLAHDRVPPAALAALLAPLCVRMIHEQGGVEDAAIALTAARDAYAGM